MRNLKHFDATICGNRPLFQIDTLLAAPDVVLNPAANDVYKMALQSVRDCVEGCALSVLLSVEVIIKYLHVVCFTLYYLLEMFSNL